MSDSNKPKYTPGPWKAIGNNIFKADEHGYGIARIRTQHVPLQKSGILEEKANAHLIASAPDMAEALVDLARALACEIASGGPNLCDDTVKKLQRAFDIHAKATGEGYE